MNGAMHTWPILGSMPMPVLDFLIDHSPPVCSDLSAILYITEFSIPMDLRYGLLDKNKIVLS